MKSLLRLVAFTILLPACTSKAKQIEAEINRQKEERYKFESEITDHHTYLRQQQRDTLEKRKMEDKQSEVSKTLQQMENRYNDSIKYLNYKLDSMDAIIEKLTKEKAALEN